MKVRDIMKAHPICCKATANLGLAVEMMWTHDCGFLPVLGPQRELCGVITDRDICIALGTRNVLASQLHVADVAATKVHFCKPDDEIHEALQIMAENRVRRLPAVGENNTVEGVLSMDDVISHGDFATWQGCCELSSEEIVRSLKRLYGKVPALHQHRSQAAA